MTTMMIALAGAGAPLAFGLALFRAAARGDRDLEAMGLVESVPAHVETPKLVTMTIRRPSASSGTGVQAV